MEEPVKSPETDKEPVIEDTYTAHSKRVHPSAMGPHSYKLTGTWVRHKRTGHVGYISYVERPREHTGKPALLWIIYPAKPVNPINMISAGSALAKEVKVLRKRKPVRFVHPYLRE